MRIARMTEEVPSPPRGPMSAAWRAPSYSAQSPTSASAFSPHRSSASALSRRSARTFSSQATWMSLTAERERKEKDEDEMDRPSVNAVEDVEALDAHFDRIRQSLHDDLSPEDRMVAHINCRGTENKNWGLGFDDVNTEDGLRVSSIENDSIIAEFNRGKAGLSKLKRSDNQSSVLQIAEDLQVGDRIVHVRLVDRNHEIGEPADDAVPDRQEMRGCLMRAAEAKAIVEIIFMRRYCFDVGYKRDRCKFSAIHVAAAHRDGADIIPQLIERGVSAVEEFQFSTRGYHATGAPIHIAAGVGNDSFELILTQLLEARADIEQQTRVQVKVRERWWQHYTALHEASLFHKPDAVSALLKKRANINATNHRGTTPLHVAARKGFVDVVRVLVEHPNVRLDLEDKLETTPLLDAVDAGVYPHRQLFYLSKKRFVDILRVAERCPPAASAMLKDKRGKVHKSWCSKERISVEQWVELMTIAPQTGTDLLEVLTEDARADDDFNHAIPRRARLKVGRDVHSAYVPDQMWWFDKERRTGMAWHSKFAPTQQRVDTIRLQSRSRGETVGWTGRRCPRSVCEVLGRCCSKERLGCGGTELGDLVPVRVQKLAVRGFLCPGVLQVLSDTDYHFVFVKLQTRALLDGAWKFVRVYYCVELIYDVLDVLVLLWCVIRPPEEEQSRRLTWGFFAVSSCREGLYEVNKFCSIVMANRFVQIYLQRWESYADIVSLVLRLQLVFQTFATCRLDEHPTILAVVALIRWGSLAYTCRAFTWLGQKILPIMSSFLPMIGIFIVTALSFMGFLHAFLALELQAETPARTAILVGTFRLLLLGDGDGFNAVLGLGGADSGTGTIVTRLFCATATFVFCICILNIFIAVHGEAYEIAQEKAFTSIRQEKAAIALQCYLRPHWPPPLCRRRRRSADALERDQVVEPMDSQGSELAGGPASRPRREEELLTRDPWKFSQPVLVVVASSILSVPAWLYFILLHQWHPVWESFGLLIVALFNDMLLLQRTWELNDNGEDVNYLWICGRQDYDESTHWPSGNVDTEKEVVGRLNRMKKDLRHRFHTMGGELVKGRALISNDLRSVRDEVELVGERVSRMEETLHQLREDFTMIAAMNNQRESPSGPPATARQTSSTSPSEQIRVMLQAFAGESSSATAARARARPRSLSPGGGSHSSVRGRAACHASERGVRFSLHRASSSEGLEAATPPVLEVRSLSDVQGGAASSSSDGREPFGAFEKAARGGKQCHSAPGGLLGVISPPSGSPPWLSLHDTAATEVCSSSDERGGAASSSSEGLLPFESFELPTHSEGHRQTTQQRLPSSINPPSETPALLPRTADCAAMEALLASKNCRSEQANAAAAEAMPVSAPESNTPGRFDHVGASSRGGGFAGDRPEGCSKLVLNDEAFAPQRGDPVEIWSKGKDAWILGFVVERLEEPGLVDGYYGEAGTMKVVYGKGRLKYVKPEEVGSVLRPPQVDAAQLLSPNGELTTAGGCGSPSSSCASPGGHPARRLFRRQEEGDEEIMLLD